MVYRKQIIEQSQVCKTHSIDSCETTEYILDCLTLSIDFLHIDAYHINKKVYQNVNVFSEFTTDNTRLYFLLAGVTFVTNT